MANSNHNLASDQMDAEFEPSDEFDAAFDAEVIEEVEKIYHSLNTRRCRWMLLLMMTKDSESLFKMCEEDPEAFFKGFEAASAVLGWYRYLVDILETGHRRLLTGLCGVDMEASSSPFMRDEMIAAIRVSNAEEIAAEIAQGGAK